PEISRRLGGTGLGLTICQRLVGMLAGEIKVESRVGEGTAFTVELPVGEAAALELVESDALSDAGQASGGVAPVRPLPCRVLVVEDNRGLQFMLRRMLEVVVEEVAVAGNGEEAIREVERSTAAGAPYHVL